MTIRRGSEWGASYTITGHEPVAHSDSEVLDAIAPALRNEAEPPTVVLRGGDLLRMLGGRPPDASQRFDIDVLEVTADDHPAWAVGHVIARRRLWAGRFVVAMNGQFVGEWNLAPRAHPNDGLVDILDGSLALRERLQARRRVRSGMHLPHPALVTQRARSVEFRFEEPLTLFVDGRRGAACRHLVINVRPDAATVAI